MSDYSTHSPITTTPAASQENNSSETVATGDSLNKIITANNLEQSTEDSLSKILTANSLEQCGDIEGAIRLYQEVIALDGEETYREIAKKALENLEEKQAAQVKTPIVETVAEIEGVAPVKTSLSSRWQRLSLKTKATVLMIALSTLPVFGVGAIAYHFANQSITAQITATEESLAVGMADKVNRFMFERYGDISVLSQLPILANPKVREIISRQEKDAVLNRYLKSYGFYDSIAVFDTKGNVIAQSEGKALANHSNREYFKKALQTGESVITNPEVSKSTGKMVIHLAAPIKDSVTGAVIGVVRTRIPIKKLKDVVANFGKNGQEYHIIDQSGRVIASQEEEKEGTLAAEHFPALTALQAANKVATTTTFDPVDKDRLLLSYSPMEKLEGMPQLPWDALMGIETEIGFAPQRQLLEIFALGTGLTAIIVAALAIYLADRATRPILAATQAVEKVGQGELDTRIDVKGEDEVAQLGLNINLMAGQLKGLLQQQEAEAQRQEAEAKSQRQAKETLQQEVIKLLLEIEGAQKGDLTVKGKVTEGVVGSIADAFNTTISKLQDLVVQVKTVSSQVNELSQSGEASVRQLSDAALIQSSEVNQALEAVGEINISIQSVADSATEAARIAHQALTEAQEGEATMDKTVDSIEKIRSTVAGTAKKVKQLAESSQEISQIVGIISNISEKTNILAFNASVEAARAGEHGQGFRVVADEVRRLADRVTDATKEIQTLVGTIQQETSSVLQAMENSTTEVVTGTQFVLQTKQILQSLALTSQQIDVYLQIISSSTTEQTNASQQVNQKMAGVATIAEDTSTEAQEVVNALQILVNQSQALQSSISQFRVQE